MKPGAGCPHYEGGLPVALTLSDSDFERLSRFIKSNYGIDLTKKRQLIASRLSTSIQARGFADFTAFIDYLLKTKDESAMTLLLDKLTTNYTFFMREEDHLEYFAHNIIPDIVRRHERDKVLSIWSAGCSTGEEPYNISMYVKDYLGAQASKWDTRVLATDISQRALTQAQKGVYQLPDTVPDKWKRQYFTPAGADDAYKVAPAIRDNVIFRTFNLMDPITFRLKFDVIFCRNVMIYFDQPTKDALVRRFYDATAPGGYLLISYAENLSPNAPYWRLAPATYQKRRTR